MGTEINFASQIDSCPYPPRRLSGERSGGKREQSSRREAARISSVPPSTMSVLLIVEDEEIPSVLPVIDSGSDEVPSRSPLSSSGGYAVALRSMIVCFRPSSTMRIRWSSYPED